MICVQFSSDRERRTSMWHQSRLGHLRNHSWSAGRAGWTAGRWGWAGCCHRIYRSAVNLLCCHYGSEWQHSDVIHWVTDTSQWRFRQVRAECSQHTFTSACILMWYFAQKKKGPDRQRNRFLNGSVPILVRTNMNGLHEALTSTPSNTFRMIQFISSWSY